MAKRSKDDILAEPRRNRIIILESLDFLWDESELREIILMWQKGIGISSIAEYFERDADEVLLAVIHLAREDKISDKTFGVSNIKPDDGSRTIWLQWRETAEQYNVSRENFRARLKKGMTPEQAATTPLDSRGRKGKRN